MVFNRFAKTPPAETSNEAIENRLSQETKFVEKIEALAQKILDVRKIYIDGQGSSLADLYDPLTMPGDLLRAHRELDKAVDKLYRKEPFTSERERVEFLFALYESVATPLVPAAALPRRKKR